MVYIFVSPFGMPVCCYCQTSTCHTNYLKNCEDKSSTRGAYCNGRQVAPPDSSASVDHQGTIKSPWIILSWVSNIRKIFLDVFTIYRIFSQLEMSQMVCVVSIVW